MVPGDHLAVDGTEEQNNPNKGRASLKSAQEVHPARDPVSRGNAIATDLISTQPLPLPAGSSQDSAGFQKPQCDVQKPTCPRCGLSVPDHRPPALRPPVGSGSRSSGSRNQAAGLHQAAATHADSCLQLLLACLSCQGSLLLLGLMEACSSCLHTLCTSCCYACARCCSAVQEAPVEEFNCHTHCHSVLFDSCCESTECLEFCVECCEICHRS